MAKVKQITAWVDSYPGTIGRIAKALGNAKVNITSFTAYGTGGENPIRPQGSSPVKGEKGLRDLGIPTTGEEGLRMKVSYKPGGLGGDCSRLGPGGIHIGYA